MRQIKIDGSHITLGQLLKKLDLIDSGGQAKFFLMETEVKVNNIPENRRGRKIFPLDQVEIAGYGVVQVVQL
jgi:ribosome-associated protein